MPGTLRTIIAKIFTSRDELSKGNLRGGLWAAFLVFPLSFIICDMRAFGPEATAFGLKSFELLNFTLGFGWFVLFFLPKRSIISALRLSAVMCAVILPFQMILPEGLPLLAMFMAFEFFIGTCLGSSFYIFCFTLNNVERLLGVCITSLYFGIFYNFLWNFPAFVAFMKTWGSAASMVFYLAVVFCSFRKKDRQNISEPDNNSYHLSVFLLIILVLVCYLIWSIMNYRMLDENVRSLIFGIASPVAIALVFIITSFMCGGAIKLSKSLKMYRIYCLIHFIFYIVVNGLLILIHEHFAGMSQIVGFGIVVSLCCLCFSMLPYLQRKIFNTPWSDGLKLANMIEYAPVIAEVEQLDETERLGLSPREKEIFILLLGDSQRKHIANTLKVGEGTVNFHVNNLYHKLGIQSRAELFSKYGKYGRKAV